MAKKTYFHPVDPKVSFPEMENRLLGHWYKAGIVEKYLEKNKNSKKVFSFLDGPITANNPMGVHHAWGRTYKDLWQRFKTMQGYKQRYQNGFDCQGLWVEVEVEKELGLGSKKDIENLVQGDKKASVARFVDLCKERVWRYSKIQTEQSKRLGYFADWENSYYTMSDENNYMIWHFLKRCHEKGLIYKGHDVVPWCPRCETAISEHEILTEDYRELTHDSVYLELPIVGREKEYLLIWTTTPWTIPANTVVAVDGDLDYALVRDVSGNTFWVARELVEVVFGGKYEKIVKTVKGRELVDLKYRSPFDELPAISEALEKYPDSFHVVIETDDKLMPITVAEGTGLVHTSTSTGQEDFRLGAKLDLPVIPAINDRAEYLNTFGLLSGKNAKSDPNIIFDWLKSKESQGQKWIFRILPYKHRYPACWRCKSELVWKIADEWYISMKGVREDMKKIARKINWIPKFGLKRELDWLKNMHDWLISKKNRYWGLALPIWECLECGKFEVIGEYKELKERAVEGWKKFEGRTPHKPWIDEVKIRCSNCGAKSKRIEDVGNPWLDAGIVPFSTVSEDNKSQPLYTTNRQEWSKWIPADFITESFPGQFKNWFYSLIAQSTVLENIQPYRTVLGFGTLLAEDGRPMHKSWGNAIEFNEAADRIGVDVMRWMYCRANPAENLLFGYRLADDTRRRFLLKLWNVYNFFVTYANIFGFKPQLKQNINLKALPPLDRWVLVRLDEVVGKVTQSLEDYDAYAASASIEEFIDDLSNWYLRRSRKREDKNRFYTVMYRLLVTLSKLLAPFTPFVADEIYMNLTKEDSVHLTSWPRARMLTDSDHKILREMLIVREIVEKGHSLRKQAGIVVRQPLAELRLSVSSKIQGYEELIKDELNVKRVEIKENRGPLKLELDTRITPELKSEGEAREIVRRIQEERKKLGTRLDELVEVYLPEIPMGFEEYIRKSALVSKLHRGEFRVSRQ